MAMDNCSEPQKIKIFDVRGTCYILFFVAISPFFLNDLYNPIIKDTWLYWILELMSWVVIPLIFCFYMHRQKVICFSDMFSLIFIKQRRPVLLIFIGILFVPVFYWVYTVSFYLFEGVFGTVQIVNHTNVYRDVISDSGKSSILIILYYSITAGVVEELYYRGICRTFIKNKLCFVLSSSLLFSAAHWGDGGAKLFATFILGLVYAWVYVKIKNLWPLIISHALMDILLFANVTFAF